MQQYIPRQNLSSSDTRILKGVVELLATKGFAKTSIGELSLVLGMSKGLIHYHFESKEMLLQETVAYIYSEARRYMEQQVWRTDNPWSQLQTFINLSCQYYADDGQLIKALGQIRANFKPKQAISYAEVLASKELEDLQKVLITGQSLGVFRSFDPVFGALTLRMSLNGAAQKILTSKEPEQAAVLCAAELIEMFRRAWTIER